MNGKFIVYALVISLACTALSWSKLLSGPGSQGGGSGSSWSSSNSGYSGSSWGGGGHK